MAHRHPARRLRRWPRALMLLAALASLTPTAGLAQELGETSDEPPAKPNFRIDPITDGVLIATSLSLSLITEALITTGEIEATLPDEENELLPIDRWILDQGPFTDDAVALGNVGLLVTMVYAVTDITVGAFVEREDDGWTYLALYLETAGMTWMITNLFKMAVRRPRPRAYIELRDTGEVNTDTQEALSFFSLHAAMAAALAATAAYLAFTRDGPSWEGWLVAGVGFAATTATGLGRMLSAAHFTTDVLAGFFVGVGIGLLVPHLHRVQDTVLITPYTTGQTNGLMVSWEW